MNQVSQSELIEMARRQSHLRQSHVLRQIAVSDFVLSCVSAASDLHRLLKVSKAFGQSKESIEAEAMIEAAIRKEYRKQFGEYMAFEKEFRQ